MKNYRSVVMAGLFAVATQVQAMSVESISASALGSSAVRVSWSAVEGTDYYELYQDSQRIQTGITDNTVDVSGLDAATDYQFFVTACNAEGMCSPASTQADVTTASGSADLGICDAATDGSAPRVQLMVDDDGTAQLSWCEVTGADGYNLFLDNEYQTTFGSLTFSATVSYTGTEQYQVAWYANGNYPAKSAVAVGPELPPTVPETDQDVLARLDAASADNPDDVEIYFTRHAEKMTQLEEQEDGSFIEVCGETNCAEVLNTKGELRAELLMSLFREVGITDRLTHAFSSHKTRTRQTIELIVADAGLAGDVDKNPGDGIQEYPIENGDGSAVAELNPEGVSASVPPVIDALLSLPAGSVALVAGHSSTLYDIMAGIGLMDVCLE
ncbi:MAG: hypothetical protein HKN42_04000, partial [Granulosicoccus sp.]|nr:hypothetical protein [Granulosicoccus sp.]